MTPDEELEDMIKEKGKTAPRVTPEQIESRIVGEYYFRLGDAIEGTAANNWAGASASVEVNQRQVDVDRANVMTLCVLILSNGFTVIGESACVSPENYDPEVGNKIARQNAVHRIWMLEGYLLKEKLSIEARSA